PERIDLVEDALRRNSSLRGESGARFGCRYALSRLCENAIHSLRIRHRRAEACRLSGDGFAPVAREILCGPQLFVAEHTREKLRSLRRTHRGHHAQLVLAGEVRVEEFV